MYISGKSAHVDLCGFCTEVFSYTSHAGQLFSKAMGTVSIGFIAFTVSIVSIASIVSIVFI